MFPIEQGAILSVEGIKDPILIVSKNFFNSSESAIICPIVKSASIDPLHIRIATNDIDGIVLCEHMKLLDLHIRGFKVLGNIGYVDIINITDAIQSIFDY